jgi:2-dehydrotetronate isomerase
VASSRPGQNVAGRGYFVPKFGCRHRELPRRPESGCPGRNLWPVARLAANLGWLFTDRPLPERFAAAGACGFQAVEIPFPYDVAAADVAAALHAGGFECVLLNAPAGDWAAGDRGYAAQPGMERAFMASIETAIAYARICGTRLIHTMSGVRRPEHSQEAHEDTLVANLKNAAPLCAAAGIRLLIEPLNARDNPGYILTSTPQALALLDRVARPNVQMQLDLYHAQITEGDPEPRIRALAGRFAHVQVAGTPGRHEPDNGDLDYQRLFDVLDATGYSGWIGCEYRPKTTTEAGLAWAARYLR